MLTRRPTLIAVASLLAAPCGARLHAQGIREPIIALTFDLNLGQRSGYGAGLSARVLSSASTSLRVGGSYGVGIFNGATVCVDDPCDTRSFRGERRISADVRRLLGSSAFFVHGGLGVTWPHVTGNASQAWSEWGRGSTQSPLGFGELGVGLRARKSARGRWIEAGVEQAAATPNRSVYLRVGFGLF